MHALIKTLLIASFAFTSTAFAQRYEIPRGVVAQVTVSGGFAPATFPASTGVRIYENGKVESFAKYHDGRIVLKTLARLTLDRVRALNAESANLTAVELVKANPEAPMCTDAPGTTYLARNSTGEAVALKGVYGCNDYVRPDGAWSAVPEVLQGFETLARLN